MKSSSYFLASLCFTFTFLFSPAAAAPITGSGHIAGNVNVSGTTIDFTPAFSSPGGSNQVGDFAGLTGGTILDLNNGPDTGATYVPRFITFSEGLAQTIYFDLTYIAPGVGTLANCSSSALGASCTPSGSPFTLFQLPSNTVIAALQFSGNFYAGSTATGFSPGVGVFSTQTTIAGTIPQIVSLLSSGQTLTGITYSASFAAAEVPEPASLLLAGLGLAVAGLSARRKK